MDKTLRVLIVDDEELARLELKELLRAFPEVEVAGEADSAATARAAVQSLKPDVIFLDIQMPGETGFDLLHTLETEAGIVFITAYDEYAIRAFEVNALDYLIKPVYPERLARSIERLLKKETPRSEPERPLESEDFIFAKAGSRLHFIKVRDIAAIQSAREYTDIITQSGERALIHKTMQEWEGRLPSANFLRIHRTAIINLNCIDRVEEALSNAYNVYLKGLEKPFPMSQRYFTKIKKALN